MNDPSLNELLHELADILLMLWRRDYGPHTWRNAGAQFSTLWSWA